MIDKLKQIKDAWIRSNNPTEDEQALADYRMNICNSCPNKLDIMNLSICSACGCPLSKKVFSDENENCPLNKWI